MSSNIYSAINAVMNDIGAIGKTSKNTQQGFMFRGIDAVMNAINPALIKHKIFLVPEVLEQSREERVTKNGTALIYSIAKIKYTFFAEDGSSITATVIGEGMDSGDKSMNKAMSVAFKYACFQVFCIPTEEMVDPDAECHEVTKKDPKISKDELKALRAKMEPTLVSEQLLKELYKVDKLENLSPNQYKNILDNWDKVEERAGQSK